VIRLLSPMDQATVTIDIDLPPNLAAEFERQASAEGTDESELFQRMFLLYQSHRNASERAADNPS
jgi:hypothetical protein